MAWVNRAKTILKVMFGSGTYQVAYKLLHPLIHGTGIGVAAIAAATISSILLEFIDKTITDPVKNSKAKEQVNELAELIEQKNNRLFNLSIIIDKNNKKIQSLNKKNIPRATVNKYLKDNAALLNEYDKLYAEWLEFIGTQASDEGFIIPPYIDENKLCEDTDCGNYGRVRNGKSGTGTIDECCEFVDPQNILNDIIEVKDDIIELKSKIGITDEGEPPPPPPIRGNLNKKKKRKSTKKKKQKSTKKKKRKSTKNRVKKKRNKTR